MNLPITNCPSEPIEPHMERQELVRPFRKNLMHNPHPNNSVVFIKARLLQ